MAEQTVQTAIRDETFKTLRASPENNFCLDCQKKNPRWASVYLGIHLCIDCAGKHRQFGVMFSFVKSTNLDSWNRRQLTFMERGGTIFCKQGNTRALDYFKKCGIITPSNKHIDYRSAIVQKYKQILTDEVDGLLQKGSTGAAVAKPQEIQITVEPLAEIEKKDSKQETQTNIQNKAEEVEDSSAKVGKGKKKKAAKRLEQDIDFSNFDDGISQAEKDKMSKPAEPPAEEVSKQGDSEKPEAPKIDTPKIEAPKQMEGVAAKQQMEKLKTKTNVKALSSEDFKDTQIRYLTLRFFSSSVLQQNLSKFSGSTAISSAAFFGQEEPKQQAMDKIKGMISSAGEKIYGKLSSLTSYLNKS